MVITIQLAAVTTLNHLLCIPEGITPSHVGSLGKLTGLKILDLAFQRLSGTVPANVAASPVLERLSLMYNNLSGSVPDSIGASQSLSTVYLSYNNFTGWLSSFSGKPLPPHHVD